MMNSELDDERDLLPTDWLTEGVAEAECLEMEGGRRLTLKAIPGVRYFGVRLAGSQAALPLSLGRISLTYGRVNHCDVAALHLIIREWRQAGPFSFQSQKPLPLTDETVSVDLCLSVREEGMALEPVLLFEAADGAAAPEAALLIGDIRFELS